MLLTQTPPLNTPLLTALQSDNALQEAIYDGENLTLCQLRLSGGLWMIGERYKTVDMNDLIGWQVIPDANLEFWSIPKLTPPDEHQFYQIVMVNGTLSLAYYVKELNHENNHFVLMDGAWKDDHIEMVDQYMFLSPSVVYYRPLMAMSD